MNYHPLEARVVADPLPIDQSVGTFGFTIRGPTGDGPGVALPPIVSPYIEHIETHRVGAVEHTTTVRIYSDAPPLVPVAPLPRTLIAFTGLAGSGKSTAALHLVNAHGFTRTRFAGPLKAMMAALGLSQAEIEGHLKERPCALLGGRTPRYAMQTLGTEWGRMTMDDDLWVNAWRAALPAAGGVVVDDCRFDNEAAAIRAAGGFIIRIVRPGAGAGAAGHSSEGQELPFDLEIANTGTPEDLEYRVDAAVRDLSWVAAGTA